MNALIYTEDQKLIIRKPNGLQYEFDNTDQPELGFDFDVLVYDDIEIVIEKWDDDKCFDDQVKRPLTNPEKEIIENYIENSEPPAGVTLNNQYVQDLVEEVKGNIANFLDNYGFDDLTEVTFAGREGSNHPYRSNARRVLEFADSQYVIYDQLVNEIFATREDHLKPIQDYLNQLPQASLLPDHER